MKIFISVFSPPAATWGGLTRVLSLAEEARRSGHGVLVSAAEPARTVMVSRGFDVAPAPEPRILGLPRAVSDLVVSRSQRSSAPATDGRSIGSMWMVFVFSGYADVSYLTRAVRAERRAIESFRPDVILTDYNPVAFLSAVMLRIPVASTFSSVVLTGRRSFLWKVFKAATNRVLTRGTASSMAPEDLCFGNHVLKLVPSVPDLDDADPDDPHVRYVGPLLADLDIPTDVEVDRSRRFVFVYVGTGSVPLSTLKDVLPAVFPDRGECTCLVASQSIRRPRRIASVEFHPYLPVERVLPLCDWTICHGGQNSIVRSLIHDVPVIAFPGSVFERRFNAMHLKHTGAGEMGELSEFNPTWLRDVLAKRETYRERAAALGRKLRATGGPRAALDALSGWSREWYRPEEAPGTGGPPSGRLRRRRRRVPTAFVHGGGNRYG